MRRQDERLTQYSTNSSNKANCAADEESARQSDFPSERLEPRVGPQGSPPRIPVQPEEPVYPLIDALIQQCECPVLVPQSTIDQRRQQRSNVDRLGVGYGVEGCQGSHRSLPVALRRRNVSHRRDRDRPGSQHGGSLVLSHRLFIASLGLQRPSEEQVRDGI